MPELGCATADQLAQIKQAYASDRAQQLFMPAKYSKGKARCQADVKES